MSNKAPIIIIEGPDFTGKTTLALHLASLGYFYLHASHESRRSWRKTFSANVGKPMVLDRAWISEKIYGPVLRPDQDPSGWVHDRILVDRHDPIYVFCQRPFDDCFNDQKANEMEHRYAKRAFKKIWNGYQDLYAEFVADVFLCKRTFAWQSDVWLGDISGWIKQCDIPKAYPQEYCKIDTSSRMTATEINRHIDQIKVTNELLKKEADAVPRPMYVPGDVITTPSGVSIPDRS